MPTEDLPKIFNFDFFLTGEGVHEDNFKEFAYGEIAENIQNLFL